MAGFQYVRRSPILLGSFSLDLFVVLLGGATALMPIFAQEILHTGPQGLGMLRAAPAMGALGRFPAGWRGFRCATRLDCGCLSASRFLGRRRLVFGLSHNLALSLAALAVSGAADMITVVVRSSVLQLATPPEMRGRVSAVNSLFLGASNELGEFESGLTAQWLGAVRATVVGGIGALMVTGLWPVLFPALRQADELTAKALRTGLRPSAEDELQTASSK